jgi:hypothetical protein
MAEQTNIDVTKEVVDTMPEIFTFQGSSIDTRNSLVSQNENNASVVSIFPLVGNEPVAVEQTQTITTDLPTTVRTNTGGSVY